MFVITGWSASRATACTSSASPNVGPRRASPLRNIGASIGTNGSGTNSVNPPLRACCSRVAQEVVGPVPRPLDVAQHHRHVRAQARRGGPRRAPRATDRSRPCRGRSPPAPRRRGSRRRCPGASRARGRGGGRGTRRARGRASRRPARPRAPRTRGCGCPGARARIAATTLGVVVARERRVDAALEADLGRAPLPRLHGAAHDLVERNEEGGAAQVLGELPLREGAEAALEVTDVRVLDVPRHDVRDLVAADLAPEPVGRREHALALGSAGLEEPLELRRDRARRPSARAEARRGGRGTARSRARREPSDPRGRARARRTRGARPGEPPGRPSGRGRRRTPDRAAAAGRARARATRPPRAVARPRATAPRD